MKRWQTLALLSALICASVSAETVFATLEKDDAIAVADSEVQGADQEQLYVATSSGDTIKVVDDDSFVVVGRYPWEGVARP
ncbi:hypothetical protein Q9L42_018425 [Methylomarinum sp. Ch1-1]|uniref:Uncharacterized protein n=1 Tax=Methylomarinum roseum TaxID=3067653 RepID=A0AAU7NTG9_9GAMM|nr:hypothetical protein [Methylomarinum sp. Ch1-1]MDP4519649.1 hypothetical protein [Methylomarinum sp. Ch1-1]